MPFNYRKGFLMELKYLEEKDLRAFLRLHAKAFHIKSDALIDEAKMVERIEQIKMDVQQVHGEGKNGMYYPAAYCDGELVSALRVIPYVVTFDGKPVDMGGIASVITSPEYRNRGSMRLLLTDTLKKMYERGQYVSYLYPFSAGFYRKFGYDMLCEKVDWDIPMEFIRQEPHGKIKCYEDTDSCKATVKRIYETFSKNFNMCILRADGLSWKSFFEKVQPYKTDIFGYIHEGANGPDAYVFYKRVLSEKDSVMEVIGSAFTSAEALRGLLAFLGTFRSHAAHIVITLPPSVDVTFMLCELNLHGSNVKRETKYSGMARVVNVAEVLKRAKYTGSGTVTIKVTDEQCGWNNQIFKLDFDEAGSQTSVSVCEPHTAPDAEMHIREFTALIFGRYDLSHVAYLDGVKINGNEAALRKVFYKKDIFTDDRF